ncbi:hypothetical protein AALP_AA7G115900 [Arabis alpina]|uniref:DUF641 domain-containing protein n=1 Tax=Arabis alpina TaxID=50452 RepID=A0A087GHF3_ARAAL|nr:hypothetical protein AALP_AA7G115900 [Arabis alpina]
MHPSRWYWLFVSAVFLDSSSYSSIPSSIKMSIRPSFRRSQNAPDPSFGRVMSGDVFVAVESVLEALGVADHEVTADRPMDSLVVASKSVPAKQAPSVNVAEAMEAVNAYLAEPESRFRDIHRTDKADGMKKILEEVASKLATFNNKNVKLAANLDTMVGQVVQTGTLQGVVVELEEKLRAAREQISLVKEESMGAFREANDVAAMNRELEVENHSLKVSGDTIARKANRDGCLELGGRFRAILESIREKFYQKLAESMAEIRHLELVANLYLLEDLAKKEVTVKSEIARLTALKPSEEAAFQRLIVSNFSLGKLHFHKSLRTRMQR